MMATFNSIKAAINEIEAYIRGASKHQKILRGIKGAFRVHEGKSLLKKVLAKQKLASNFKRKWLTAKKDERKLLSGGLDETRKGRKLVKIYKKEIAKDFTEKRR